MRNGGGRAKKEKPIRGPTSVTAVSSVGVEGLNPTGLSNKHEECPPDLSTRPHKCEARHLSPT